MSIKHLLLLHGALGGSDQLKPLAEALDADFKVHRLDFEGHAAARSRGRPFRVTHFVENVLELMDRDGIEKAHLFGYSLGGYVALCLALAHADRVGRIATLGTKFAWDPATATREASRLDPAVIRAKVPRFADALAARHAGAGGWESVLISTADFLHDLGKHPLLTDETLPRISCPIRVMVGDRDNTVRTDESEQVARMLPHGSLTVLEDTPHPIEQVSVAVLAPFLRDFFSAD